MALSLNARKRLCASFGIDAEDYLAAVEVADAIDAGGGGGGDVASVNGQTGVVVLDKGDIGLGNVDNTSDANKPVSTAQGLADQAILDAAEDYTDTAIGNLPPPGASSDLVDSGDLVSADGDLRRLLSDNSSMSVDWQNRQLSDGIVGTTLDWASRRLLDDGGVDSIHWGNRNLVVPGGQVIVDWEDDAVDIFQVADAVPGTASSYALSVQQGGDYAITLGADDDGNYIQSWNNKALILNPVGNNVGINNLTPAEALDVTGNILASGRYKSASYAQDKFVAFDNDGVLLDHNEFGFSTTVGDYLGARWSHVVTPSVANEGKTLNNLYAAYNPVAADSKQYWNNMFIEAGLGTDNSGFQVGDPIDIKSSLVVQDITYTSKRYGADGDVITIEYTGGATAGNEVVTSPSNFEYVIQIEDGVSTADQIIAAINDSNNIGNIAGTLTYVVSGTGSDPQVVAAQTNLAGGENADGGVTVLGANLYSRNTSNVGRSTTIFSGYDLGNGNDPIQGYVHSAYSGNATIHDNCSLYNLTVLDFNLNVSNNGGEILSDFRGININGNLNNVGQGVLPVQVGFSMDSATYMNVYQTTINSSGSIAQTVNVFADFNNFNDIGGNYYGVAIQPNIQGELGGGIFGINVSPNIAMAFGNSVGLNVNMNDVDLYAGVQASLTLQDLHFVAVNTGSGNNDLQIEYIDDGTGGAETVSIAGMTVQVHMEDGVSTAQNIYDALIAVPTFVANVTVTISGTASDPQTAVGPTNLAGGVNPGTKRAAQFNGDVDIQGNLSFTGALALGKLNAYALQEIVDGGGAPGSIHTLISSPFIPDNTTVANADLIGLNTACLIQIGENSVVTSSFLGLTALGLPAVVSMKSGSTVDVIAGATFAISMDSGATGGTVDLMYLCNALAIPNGTTTVNKMRGFCFELPFGIIATETWGLYSGVDCYNWMQGSLKIGGASGSTDKVTNASIGLEMHNKAIRLAVMDTAARDALTAVAGMMIFNSDTNVSELYNGSAWV